VGCHEQIWGAPELAGFWQWLNFVNVEDRSGDLACGQGSSEMVFVACRASAGVDENCRLFHFRKAIWAIEKIVRTRHSREGPKHKVGFRQGSVIVIKTNDFICPLGLLLGDNFRELIDSNYPHSKCSLGHFGNFGAYVPIPDNRERFAAEQLYWLNLPMCLSLLFLK